MWSKTCHAGLTAIHQILMNCIESLFAIVIICIDHNERSLDDLLRYKHGLTSSPRLCTSFRHSSRNVVDIPESVVNSYVVGGVR